MKIVYNKYIPFRGFTAINLFGVLYVRIPNKVSEIDLNHEEIHSAQALDLCRIKIIGHILFYILYFTFWVIEILLPPYKRAYHDICFEKEAYCNEGDFMYLDNRTKWSGFKKIYWRRDIKGL